MNKEKKTNYNLKKHPEMISDDFVTAQIRPNLDIIFNGPDITLNRETVGGLRDIGEVFKNIRKRLTSEGIEVPKSRTLNEF